MEARASGAWSGLNGLTTRLLTSDASKSAPTTARGAGEGSTGSRALAVAGCGSPSPGASVVRGALASEVPQTARIVDWYFATCGDGANMSVWRVAPCRNGGQAAGTILLGIHLMRGTRPACPEPDSSFLAAGGPVARLPSTVRRTQGLDDARVLPPTGGQDGTGNGSRLATLRQRTLYFPLLTGSGYISAPRLSKGCCAIDKAGRAALALDGNCVAHSIGKEVKSFRCQLDSREGGRKWNPCQTALALACWADSGG